SHALNTSTGRELEDALAAVKSHQEALAAQQQVAAAAQGHSATMSEEALEAERKRAQALAAHQEELELVIENAQRTIQGLEATNQDLEQQLRASENKISILLDNFQGPESVRNSMASLNGNDDLIQRLMEASHHAGGVVGSGRSYLTPMSHGSHLTDRSSADSLANELELMRSNWGQAHVQVAATTTATPTTSATPVTAVAVSPLSPAAIALPSSPVSIKSPVDKPVSSSSTSATSTTTTSNTNTNTNTNTNVGSSSSSSTSAQKLEEYERMIEDMAHQRRQYEE
ncbi:hypothetical protein BGZ95_003235, partial [Linnemannia exigua]